MERIRGLSSPDTVKRLYYSVSSRGRSNDIVRLTVPWACELRGCGMCDVLCVCEIRDGCLLSAMICVVVCVNG